jgi:predicted dienelactone hydrolase
MLRKILKLLAGALVLLLVLGLAVYIATGPQRPPRDSRSADWLQTGPYQVATADTVFVDQSRSTPENRGAAGSPQRTLNSTLWYPVDFEGDLPLIVHSHGILSTRTEMPYLTELLASYGYLVVAADYPLTSASVPGGANAQDVVNQPGDVSFLIDSVVALRGADKPFSGTVDTRRIGLSGYSLGGLTTYLASFHPAMRDSRIAAAVAIAGPSAPFTPEFFTTASIPTLAVAGTADALIEFRRNAADVPARAPTAELVGIEGGSHLGFVGVAEPTFRFMNNPDTLGCAAVLGALGEDPNAVFAELGSVAEGVDMNRDLPDICGQDSLDPALHPGRQQMITQVAVLSFFESVFNPDPARRDQAREVLTRHLPQDFAEASYQP